MNPLNKENLFNLSFDSLIENISLDDMFNPNPEIGSSNLESFKYDKNPMENISDYSNKTRLTQKKELIIKMLLLKQKKYLLIKKEEEKQFKF